MSDLTTMYARLRGTLADQQPTHQAKPPCPHPRRLQRIDRTEEFIMGTARYSGYTVKVTTEIHCDGCDTIIGTETHTERRR